VEIQIDQIVLVVHQAVAPLLVDHQVVVHLHHVHLDQIQIVAVKIYRRAVVLLHVRVHQVAIAKGVMQMIRVEFVQRLWIAINHVYVREFSNQIFQKMSLAKS
jgi:hypothetical protein